MKEQAEYRAACEELQQPCRAVIRTHGDRITVAYPHASEKWPDHWRTIQYSGDFWRGAFIDLVAYAKREGIPLPPSAQALLEKE